MASFTRQQDRLSQWARYGGNGRGVALRFRVATDAPSGELDTISALNVHYHHSITKLAEVSPRENDDAVLRLAKHLIEYQTNCDVLDHMGNAVFVVTDLLSVAVKSEAFAEEAEVRLHRRLPKEAKDVRFRSGPYGATPYVELPIDGSQVRMTGVMLGGVVPEDNQWSFRWLLDRSGFKDVEVSRSETRVR